MRAKSSPPHPNSDDGIRLDPRNLKGLAHPLRVRLLGALREYGPATASLLAARLHESSGATSYHLRQLESFGFIVEDTTHSSKRDRWWRAAHRMTRFNEGEMARNPETALLGTEFLRAVAGAHGARMLDWIDALATASGPWAQAGSLSDWALRLTPKQARALNEELAAVIGRYPAFDPEAKEVEGTLFVSIQLQLLPRLPAMELPEMAP